MTWTRIAGQPIYFSIPLPELAFVQTEGEPVILLLVPKPQTLVVRARGWLANEQRDLELWTAPPGNLLKTHKGSDIYISPNGGLFIQTDADHLNAVDREALLGPALLLALAARGTWCLHASAAMLHGQAFVFLGESGRGKSTLAAFLARQRNWAWVADDILPFTIAADEASVWPKFPQLKVRTDSQPGQYLPEKLPARHFFLLGEAANELPTVRKISRGQAAHALLSHTASTRLLDPRLLAAHLRACTDAANHISVYELTYPRRVDALPDVRKILEDLR
ncbi:MAG: hypothetical protein HFACDABA_01042 [Anaerolineales bacterium]|nr:hypothetical protein [Anaerolineales bacterium]